MPAPITFLLGGLFLYVIECRGPGVREHGLAPCGVIGPRLPCSLVLEKHPGYAVVVLAAELTVTHCTTGRVICVLGCEVPPLRGRSTPTRLLLVTRQRSPFLDFVLEEVERRLTSAVPTARVLFVPTRFVLEYNPAYMASLPPEQQVAVLVLQWHLLATH
jgi:hypothetical protein